MKFQRAICTVLLFLLGPLAYSLPLSFGIHQGDLSYDELSTDQFLIYHDARAPHEAAMVLETLASARPILERWFDERRSRPLPVILSATTSGSSFANLITDAMELQTLGTGPRDLFLHEYVHMAMYLHLRNFLGPAGIVIHIPWMPAWFIEGLAEALTVSLGSSRQASIERYQALSDDWPSYDRLHSLYTKGDFFVRGYASSGAFVTWLLKKGYEREADFLPKLLRRFYRYTLPYYYPLSMTPFTDFLPFDEALRDVLGKKGRDLYEDYKHEALSFWQKQDLPPLEPIPDLYENPEPILLNTLTSHGKDIVAFSPKQGEWQELKLSFSPKDGWWDSVKATDRRLSKQDLTGILSLQGTQRLAVQSLKDQKNGTPRHSIVSFDEHEEDFSVSRTLLERAGRITGLWESKSHIIFEESDTETKRLCMADKIPGTDSTRRNIEIRCPMTSTLPASVSVIGSAEEEDDGTVLTSKLWYSVEKQTLNGDQYELWEWDLDTDRTRKITFAEGGSPEAVFHSRSEHWLLVSERDHQSLRKINQDGTCLGSHPLTDFVVKGVGLSDASLVLILWRGAKLRVRKMDLRKLPLRPCQPTPSHTSPLLMALGQANDLSLSDALKTEELPQVQRPFDTDTTAKLATKRSPAPWRARPVLAFPWIGADDALGYQLGVVTVPLMDHMQNETLFASILLGVQSRYPSTYLTLISDRFWPRLSVSAFRRQVWNGRFLLNDLQTVESSYIDEKGLRASAYVDWYLSDALLRVGGGFLLARKHQYIGPPVVIEGTLVEPFLSATLSNTWGKWAWNLNLGGSLAPPVLNKDFDYNVMSASTEWTRALPFWSSSLSLNVEAQRTRGRSDKTPLLKQMYIPLKTFIPGSGGGYNKNSFPLYGRGSLFSIRFGDTQARSSLNWSVPLIKDLDKLLWVVYLEELRFSSFVNYGGVWNQGHFNADKHLLLAHGHNIDLLLENKGVRLNFGLGVGQVRKDPFQVFFNAGFDALF